MLALKLLGERVNGFSVSMALCGYSVVSYGMLQLP